MYDLMVTVSLLVDDIDDGVETLRRSIGIPEPLPHHYQSAAGLDAVFCRVHKKYAVAPTFLELVAAASIDDRDRDAGVFPVAQIAARQGDRTIKWHATELAMSDETFADLAAHLDTLRVPHAFVPPDARDRFFVGGDLNVDYEVGADAGLGLEAIRSVQLGLPEEAFGAPADVPFDAEPPDMVRIVARDYLVRDLDDTLAVLERNLRWTPSEVIDEEGGRRAVMPFAVPRSARLELVEPTGSGRVADAFAEFGPGAWTVRVAVVDLDAKAADLAQRGTRHTIERGCLRPDLSATLNVPFEFVTA